MNKKILLIFLLLLCFFLSPISNSAPTRLLGFESGDLLFFEWNLYYTIRGMEKLGLVKFDEPIPIPPEDDYPRDSYNANLWRWAGEHNKTDKIVFLKDGFYSDHFQLKQIELDLVDVRDRIIEKKDVDIVLSFGTVMARYFSNSSPPAPLIIIGSIDPIRGKVIYSKEDSGVDMITALIFPDMQIQQVKAFYDRFKFKTLGLLFENSVNGRAFSGIDAIIPFLESNGVKLEICNTLEVLTGTQEERGNSIVKCMERLVRETDAIYISYQVGYTKEVVEKVVKLAREYKIPTSDQFALSIKKGYLFSYFPLNYYEEAGLEYAKRIQMIMNGTKPRDIKQVYDFDKEMTACYNKETANILGIDITNEKCVY